MKNTLKIGIAAAAVISAVLMTAGCASTQLSEPENERVSLVVGYFDMEEAPARLGWVEIKKLQPKEKKPFYYCGVDGGLFFNSYLEPGVYKFMEFGGTGKGFLSTGDEYTFQFPSQGKSRLDLRIEEPGIYYVGSYKYVDVKTGFFEQGRYELEQIEKPGERELLSMMLEKAGTTGWRERILARLEELGGPLELEEE